MAARSRSTVRAWRRRRDSRGASAVEFALVAPLLIMLLFGIISTGFSFYETIAATDAVRAGSRFGATAEKGDAWAETVRTQTVALASTPQFQSADVCVQLVDSADVPVLSSDCPIAAPPPAFTGTLQEGECVVKVWASVPFSIQALPFFSNELDVTRSSVVRYERECL